MARKTFATWAETGPRRPAGWPPPYRRRGPVSESGVRLLSLLNSHHTRFATLVLASAVREGDAVRLDLTS
ncbi:hypothetical protein ACWIFI_29830, partial [Streptomyces albidoflavus]